MKTIIYHENDTFYWKDINEPLSLFPLSVPVINGNQLQRIVEPEKYAFVYVYDKGNKQLRPVIIKDGQYLAGNRVSNFWTYQFINADLTLGETRSDYGNFYESPIQFNIKLDIRIEIKETSTTE